MSDKQKRITIDEIHAIIHRELTADEQRSTDRAERTFQRLMRQISRGKFRVMEKGRIRVVLHAFTDPFSGCMDILQDLCEQAGFVSIRLPDYYDDQLFRFELDLMTEEWDANARHARLQEMFIRRGMIPPPPPQPPSTYDAEIMG